MKIQKIIIILMMMVVFVGCGKKVEVVEEEVEETNVEKKEQEVSGGIVIEEGDVDTSDWRVYRNEEYGVEFKYPKTYNDFSVKETKKGDIGVSEGESVVLHSNDLVISFYSDDYNSFMSYPYKGNIDLSVQCEENKKIINDYQGIGLSSIGFCENISINNQNTFYEIVFSYLPECSGVSITQKAYLNVDNYNYNGLIISKTLNNITKDLNQYYDCSKDDNEELEEMVVKYLNDIVDNKIDNETLKELKDFHNIIDNFKFSNEKIDISYWNNFENSKYGIKLKYPKWLNLKENEESEAAWRIAEIRDKNAWTENGFENRKKTLLNLFSFSIGDPGCSSGGPDPVFDGLRIDVHVHELAKDNKTFDKLIKRCEFGSESGYCNYEFINVNGVKSLLIDGPNHLCTYPFAYILDNDLLYEIRTIFSYNEDYREEKGYEFHDYKETFYQFLKNIEMIDIEK